MKDVSAQPRPARRVGFFGGSFDPPHLGHLAVARAAQAALELETVLFAPVGAQPLKPSGSSASFQDRLTMTRLAIAGEPGFEVSLADAPKPGCEPNFTCETLLALRAQLPPGGQLYCLMGADSFFGLRRWRRAAEIPLIAPLVVASRPGERLDDFVAALPEGLSIHPAPSAPHLSSVELRVYTLHNAAGESAPFYLLPGLEVEISATRIREQIQSARPGQSEALLPEAVSDYIRAHGLYR